MGTPASPPSSKRSCAPSATRAFGARKLRLKQASLQSPVVGGLIEDIHVYRHLLACINAISQEEDSIQAQETHAEIESLMESNLGLQKAYHDHQNRRQLSV